MWGVTVERSDVERVERLVDIAIVIVIRRRGVQTWLFPYVRERDGNPRFT